MRATRNKYVCDKLAVNLINDIKNYDKMKGTKDTKEHIYESKDVVRDIRKDIAGRLESLFCS